MSFIGLLLVLSAYCFDSKNLMNSNSIGFNVRRSTSISEKSISLASLTRYSSLNSYFMVVNIF